MLRILEAKSFFDSSLRNPVLKMVSTIQAEPTEDACTGYLFFDPVHPGAKAHEILAERAIWALEKAEIQVKY